MVVNHLSRADLEKLVETFRAKALAEHELVRVWQTRALIAEGSLSALERSAPGYGAKP
jgi:hypothetical protein